MSVEERLIDLEVRLTYQSNIITCLDEVVREFAVRVERLERQLLALSRAESGGDAVVANDPPPHY